MAVTVSRLWHSD